MPWRTGLVYRESKLEPLRSSSSVTLEPRSLAEGDQLGIKAGSQGERESMLHRAKALLRSQS